MYMDKALISDLECGRTEHYIIIKNVQRQNVIVYIIILSSSQELSQCLLLVIAMLRFLQIIYWMTIFAR